MDRGGFNRMNKHLTNADIFKIIEKFAPKYLAYDWDNVGLQIGSFNRPVKKIMVTLDVLESVVDEAIEHKIDLIIAHHPLLFKPLSQVNLDSPKGRTIRKLIQHNITVYAAHTNLDAADGGVNDMLCDALNIYSQEVLIESETEELFKIAVYVPKSHGEAIRDALSDSGAGHIGNYSHCTYQVEGQGTFKPLEGTDPFIGTKNKLEIVDELRIETIVPSSKLNHAIKAILNAHPYEEPAYDIFPLGNRGKQYGIGRIGNLPKFISLSDLVQQVKDTFQMEHVRITGDASKKVKRVAILGGSGEKYIHQAKRKGADVYITGDMSFHTAQDALEMGLSVIDAGHYIEKVMKQSLKKYIVKELSNQDIEIMISDTNTDPFQFM